MIVGLGATGLSCAKYFAAINREFRVVDSRLNPPGIDQLRALVPNVDVELGAFSESVFDKARELVVSPGVSLKTPQIKKAIEKGVSVTGDIDIFSRAVKKPIVAVTGSNGKSTVVAILAQICKQAGLRFAVGGNLDGEQFKPALELLLEPLKDFYILELSSFQLETTKRLGALAATLLNLSADHMDRYESLDEYWQAKQQIFNGCQHAVVNRADVRSKPMQANVASVLEFGLDQPASNSLGLIVEDGREYLAYGEERIVAVDQIKIIGQHNTANALAAIGLARALGIDTLAIQEGLQQFAGLPHRCQWVRNSKGVDFYNDSKGTNVGATLAAIAGLAHKISGKVVLIAGGVGKGADFQPMAAIVRQFVKAVILIGEDAQKIAQSLDVGSEIYFSESLEAAVSQAYKVSCSGDAILLSPACASFDMFDNFQHRGFAFIEAVGAIH